MSYSGGGTGYAKVISMMMVPGLWACDSTLLTLTNKSGALDAVAAVDWSSAPANVPGCAGFTQGTIDYTGRVMVASSGMSRVSPSAALVSRAMISMSVGPSAAQLEQWRAFSYHTGDWRGLWTTMHARSSAAFADAPIALEIISSRLAIVHNRVAGMQMEQTNRRFDPAAVSTLDLDAITSAEATGAFEDIDFGGLGPTNNRGRYAGPAFAWYGTKAKTDGGFSFVAELGLRSASERRRVTFMFEAPLAGADGRCAPELRTVVAMREKEGGWPQEAGAASEELARALAGARLDALGASGVQWVHRAMGAPVRQLDVGALPLAGWPELGRATDGTQCWNVEVGSRALCPPFLEAGRPFSVEAVWIGSDAHAPTDDAGEAGASPDSAGTRRSFLLRARLEIEAAPDRHCDEPPPCAFVVERLDLATR